MTDGLNLAGEMVLVIPCSGIGKAMGTISREATYSVVEDLRPEVSDTLCLSLLVMGDESAHARVQRVPCVTIDGCKSECARRNVELAGGTVAERVQVMEVLKAHRGLKPKAVSELDEDGQALAGFVAKEAMRAVDRTIASVARKEVAK